MARLMAPMAVRILELFSRYRDSDGIYHLPKGITSDALLHLVAEVGQQDFAFFEKSDDVIWDVARHEGYIIPEYPLESSSEVKSFLREYQAQNVAQWYLQRGFTLGTITHSWLYAAVMVRNKKFWRKIISFPINRFEEVNFLVQYLDEALSFCLSDERGTDNPTLFAI